ncbi:hypothetical protein QW131_00030 [Roseibium salinum]|nr:hypothetical protein [Roseibium salinum]
MSMQVPILAAPVRAQATALAAAAASSIPTRTPMSAHFQPTAAQLWAAVKNLASSNTTASVGITSANVGASVGTGSANANLTIGTTGGEEGESGSGNSGFFSRMFAGDRDDAARRAVDGLTDKQIARYKVMCADILSNANSWDRDLVQMCQAMQ